MLNYLTRLLILCGMLFLASCTPQSDVNENPNNPHPNDPNDPNTSVGIIQQIFGDNIDLKDLANYANQDVPDYIDRDLFGDDYITDAGATLGRVLFYDVNLSSDNTISCASCHLQSRAFGDSRVSSLGVNGITARHSMRLVNGRFSGEGRFFWDERAFSLEDQTTQPIKDHIEMGFSGSNGAPDFTEFINKLQGLEYYQVLFDFVYGDDNITEERIQLALAQFISSIQSFDSKYDFGRRQVNTDIDPFPNFSAQENMGKELFITLPDFAAGGIRVGGGAGCVACHRAPDFSIDPTSLNNGIRGVIGQPGAIDFTVTKSPTLRDLFDLDGVVNGPFFHTGEAANIEEVLDHYNEIQLGPNLDPRLRPGGSPQRLNLTQTEIDALVVFLRTLSGTNVFDDAKWSDPF